MARALSSRHMMVAVALLTTACSTDESTRRDAATDEHDDRDDHDEESTDDQTGSSDADDADDESATGGKDAGGSKPKPDASLDAGATRDATVGDASSARDASTETPRDAGASKDASSSDAGSTSDAATPGSKTCSSTLKAGDTRVSLEVGGTQRSFILHVPSSYKGDQDVPLLVDLHPLLMNAQFQRTNSGYAAIADREGFLVAYPDGLSAGAVGTAWNIGVCCTTANDEPFLRALVERVKKDGCVDDSRVYAAGYSMGGGMSHYLACNAADVFAAVSPAAFDLLVESEMPCKPARPISVITFRGTSDVIVPIKGGASTPPNGFKLGTQIHFEGAENTFKRWAAINGCTGTPTASGECRTYPQCKDDVEVTLCIKQGGGHVTGDASYGWEHLKRHTKP